jgi:hypothetical protein
MDQNKLASIIHSLNVELFSDKSSYTAPNAVRNLENRTHYIDKNTLRFFNARIVGGSDQCAGTVFRLIESLPDGNGKRGFRFVVFDVWGTVLNEREFYTTSQKATNAFYKWLGEFDLVGHYREVFATRATRAKRDHDDLREAFNATFEDGAE